MIPLDLIIVGVIIIILSIIFGVLSLYQALLGILAGVLFPALMMGLTWLFTRRQGMGFGALQLGLIRGAWLGRI